MRLPFRSIALAIRNSNFNNLKLCSKLAKLATKHVFKVFLRKHTDFEIFSKISKNTKIVFFFSQTQGWPEISLSKTQNECKQMS